MRRTAREATAREEDGLVRAGEELLESLRKLPPEAEPQSGEPRERIERVRDLDDRLAALQALLHGNLDRDRRDYGPAGPAARWAVIFRGILERVVLRDALRRERLARVAALAALGRTALDGSYPLLRGLVPPATAHHVLAARGAARSALAERDALLAPWSGDPLPRWLRAVVRETGEFGAHLRKEALGKILLKAPAIAGLFVGWWLGDTFTDSSVEGFFSGLGFGGRRSIDADTLELLQFWLPIVAAALCGYAGTFVSKRIQRRYVPAADAGAKPS